MPIAVLHLIDSLAVGGAERVAVNIANHLPRDEYAVTLCTSRNAGPLLHELSPDIEHLNLKRRSTFDANAVFTLAQELRRRHVRVVHAHGTSLFLARAAAALVPEVPVLWHDHFGLCETVRRTVWTYRMGLFHIGGVIAVNRLLADWAVHCMRVPEDRVWCVRNMACLAPRPAASLPLPGTSGSRIVCLANFRPQKDHPTLLKAMARVAASHPDAHLILVGGGNAEYFNQIRALAAESGLAGRVTFLGERNDVPAVLAGCDIGVLASVSEGLPLSLLEYGVSGLAAAVTSVGECPDVLEDGRAGCLVPPADTGGLADALLMLINNPEVRQRLANRLRTRVINEFSPGPVINAIRQIYETVTRPGGAAELNASVGGLS